MNQANWDKAVAFHGHECPGLAIGVKAYEALVEKLGVRSAQDEELVCVTENDACCVDAIQVLAGCSLGKGNLVYRGTGKLAFSFFCRESGRKIRMILKAKNPGLSREAWMHFLLNAPVDEVFAFSEPRFEAPERARRLDTVVCELCGEGAPENKIRLQQGKKVCLDCLNEYKRGWEA